MNWVHIHLISNHIGTVGSVIGLLILACGLAWKSPDIKRFTLYYFVGLGLATLFAYLTGEPAEEVIEHASWASHAVIERHEEAAIFGLIAIELAAVYSLIGLTRVGSRFLSRSWYFKGLLLLAFVSSAALIWVGNLGGKIRHTELNPSVDNGTPSGEE